MPYCSFDIARRLGVQLGFVSLILLFASTANATSSALAPSNVGGIGSVSLGSLVALLLTLLLVPPLRRRYARR